MEIGDETWAKRLLKNVQYLINKKLISVTEKENITPGDVSLRSSINISPDVLFSLFNSYPLV